MFAEMMRAGYQPEEVSALLVAMFVSQEPEAIRRAWEVRITELLARTPLRPPTCACPRAPPLGKGVLSLREFGSAFALLGDAVDLVDVEREFRLVDRSVYVGP